MNDTDGATGTMRYIYYTYCDENVLQSGDGAFGGDAFWAWGGSVGKYGKHMKVNGNRCSRGSREQTTSGHNIGDD